MALADYPLPPFEDRRHPQADFPPPRGAELELLTATLEASDIVTAAPVHWYSLPAGAKLYLDARTAWLRAEGVDPARRRPRRCARDGIRAAVLFLIAEGPGAPGAAGRFIPSVYDLYCRK
jgi:hypothetical protein